MHHLDEGDPDATPIVLMHGEPSWSYLYRKMIPPLVDAGYRVIAPDLVGFGRSDKPTETADYTYARHVEWARSLLVDHLDLRDAVLFAQDWGGLVGLRVLTAHPDRFAGVAVGNTGLPTGDAPPSDAFLAWRRFSQETEDFAVGFMLQAATNTDLSPAEVAAYDAPFPDDRYKAGARIFPSLVPISSDDPASDDNRAAWRVLESYDRPFVCCFSDGDPVTRGGDKPFRERVPGARGQPHVTVEGGHHFFQEDCAEQLVAVVLDLAVRAARP
jgi:haloalkane dehalogenase